MDPCQSTSSREEARRAALRQEQAHLTRLYTRLDAVRERAETALREAHGRGGGGTRQALIEREVTAEEQARLVARFSSVERGLCFGRIDHRDGESFHIGRIGLRDEEHEPLLIDWRAPAARLFYTATPQTPGSLVRRRHLHTRDRTVVGVEDEVFDLDGLTEEDRRTLVGEAALLAALRRGRTGRMSDIVATIQAEQDQVIRSGLAGVLVVQGGPGTGKTVAALHRAAYLLYTHRDTLARRGVLIIGPNPTFLRYIGQVLPSLGETDAVPATVGELFPGVRATETEEPSAALLKGDPRMARLVAEAVRDRQRTPRDGDGLRVEVDDMELRVGQDVCRRARDRARGLRKPHNIARKLYVNDVLKDLALDQARRLGRPPLDDEDVRYARASLWAEPTVRAAIDRLWPYLTPQRLLTELFADPAALQRVARRAGLGPDEARTLLRPATTRWTVSDVPLLDEAAELLGEDDSAARALERVAAEERRAEERYAQGVLELTGLSEQGFLDARALAERHRDPGARLTTAERAWADRRWAYGHVIVDEAQELSAMAWRMVMRRVPTRSLTIVGDVAQTSDPAGARSWAEMLDPYVGGRWRETRLLVNYRTPAEIMEVAADVLAEVAPGQQPPESVRDGGTPPRAVRMATAELPEGLPRLVEAERAAIGEGRVAVITARSRVAEVRAALPDLPSGATPEALDSPATTLTTTEAKGLEFDAVIVVDPDGIVADSPKGGHDLYVAVTRATRRLTVVHHGELPSMLGRLRRVRG
ncbi:HelD family protein [Marinactinospora thermotolerans]|uniref:DNA helicase IV n=1 Tax=Marinactinospora thermotolerans DSM 45154 TaxID=1122192 RepID=A0A1T4KBI7_9ACTN|nr:ATP-binding domain-containing protein [Marinactinospora thermotolerans]SJZ39781.1 DNA helicase IV [Marinactinospora thermotolerans DSM 45154]